MTGKDPKDMTASELLRWAAENDKLRMRCDMCMKLYMMDNCGGHDCNDWLNDLADKIEADLAKARRGGLERCAKSWAKANGWPEFRKGEGFGEWLERCFIPRPRFEDGEPVQFGDYDIDWGYTDECRVPGALFNATAVDVRGKLLATTFNKIVAVAKTDEQGRVKSFAPEVLGADGLPIKVGELVYLTASASRLAGTVSFSEGSYSHGLHGVQPDETLVVKDPSNSERLLGYRFVLFDHANNPWCPASWLTHTPPDTQQKIDEDATVSPGWYCSEHGIDIGDDPDMGSATVAMVLDLLRRQRELDKRTGGE